MFTKAADIFCHRVQSGRKRIVLNHIGARAMSVVVAEAGVCACFNGVDHSHLADNIKPDNQPLTSDIEAPLPGY
ncbi:uncharacterized protein EI90DRAFT_2121007 [Cantharellus anzutake]|uniref:uncharacterized protein n=1 Tax=Cantharellus anzutake TaxID=1750568 RepID=UPI001908FBAE|nr:uncharacterized protein EI90DRAFT_225570 [Cantharellus anzutake]XP_038912347.1 uncharacterized protein EI90DRAFT_2121007 [Cantharellus anzutake]KAF8316500.1 hypothetical protein EI90DRAFT_225570 [Cantharellus anzutake]KAF8325554.1 hypothetical protein EI90DRAFT_2121007 [Cantharellus anzutake]